MKKTKNETAAVKKPDSAVQNKKAKVNDPSEKIRSNENETSGLPFKKILYGYDPNEVASYIKELSGNNEASARNYELKLSSIKEELALSNRERDSYGEKYRECKARLDKSVAIIPEKSDAEETNQEYEKIIDALNDRLERAENENEILRSQIEKNNIKETDEYTGRIALLEEENRKISAETESLQRRNEELFAAEQKYEVLFADYNSLVSQHESVKAEKNAKEKELSDLKEELARKAEEIKALSLQNDELKRSLADLEAENSVLNQCTEENEKEIIRLKEANKVQAHEYAEKINKLESEQAAGKLAMQKEMKLRDYYINQAQTTLSELSEQIEQIKRTFAETC